MPRDLFGDISDPSVRVRTRSRYTVPISFAAHALVVAALMAIPILAPAVLPSLRGEDIVYAEVHVPPLPPSPPPPAPRAIEPAVPPVNPSAAPVTAPEAILPETGREFDMALSPPTDVGIVGMTGSLETVIAEPPAPPPAPPAPVRPGGHIRAPLRIRDAAPVYPAIALAARVEGTVVIDTVIDEEGRVQSARVLRSIPLLDEAALAAVRQWAYTPTLLNGVPVPVVMTVTVTFRLR
jgi:protein TonB